MGADVAQVRSLVFGSGGLLGKSVNEALKVTAVRGPIIRPSISWYHSAQASEQIEASVEEFLAVGDPSEHKEIYWCAGVATQRTVGDETDQERRYIGNILAAIRSNRPPTNLRLFFASTAGGVYGDTGTQIASETSASNPRDAYGHTKLELEAELRRFAQSTSSGLVIGRLSSLYGSQQNMQKRQGLLSHLALAIARSHPLEIFTSLSSTRNYLDSRTAAKIAVHHMRSIGLSEVRMRNICAPYNVSVAELLSLAKYLAGRSLRTIHTGSSRPDNSRIATMFPGEVTSLTRTTMAEGLASLVQAARRDTLRM